MQPKKFNLANFSERLEFAIERSGLTKHAIAQAAGMSHTSVNRYLKGEIPKQDSLLRLAEALNISSQWLRDGGDFVEQSSTFDVVTKPSAFRDIAPGSPPSTTLRLQTNDDYKALVEAFIGQTDEESLRNIIAEMGERLLHGDKTAADQARVLIDLIHTHRPETFQPRTELPYYGAVAAGKPSDVDYHSGETLVVPGAFRRRPHYIVRVRGESMEPDFPDGCYVVVRALEPGEFARKGDIVIAHDGDGPCIKKLEYRHSQESQEGSHRKPTPHLVSINPDYPDIIPVYDRPIQGVIVDQYDADFFDP